DEPLSALDENLRADMRALIRDLQRTLRITTLFVTHDQREASTLADQIVLLLDGRIAQAGPPRIFYTAPVNDAVARFFGWCIVSGRRVGNRLDIEGSTFEVPANAPGATALSFHPSSARLLPVSSPASAEGMTVIVDHVTDLGTEVQASVRLPGGTRLDLV